MIMRRNLVLLSLVLFFGVGTASATTPTFNVFTATPNLANIGLSEVLGQVAITADASCGTAADGICLTADGNIVLTFSMVLIDNGTATGIETIVSPALCAPVAGTVVSNVDTNGDTVVDSGRVSVQLLNPGPPVDLASGCQILIRGVRARIASSFAATPGATVFVQLTTSPSGIAAFTPTTAPVGSSAIFRTFSATSGQVLLCIGTLSPIPSITVIEGYNDAFVDAVPTAFPRIPAAGANANTQVLVTLTGLPTGVTVDWGTVGVTTFLGPSAGKRCQPRIVYYCADSHQWSGRGYAGDRNLPSDNHPTALANWRSAAVPRHGGAGGQLAGARSLPDEPALPVRR